MRTGARLVAGATGVLALLGTQVRRTAGRAYLPNEPDWAVRARVGPDGVVGAIGHEELLAPPRDGVVRLVAVGDSTARGVGAERLADAVPVALARLLAEQLDRTVEAVGLGVSGARLEQVRRQQVPRVAAHHPHVVLVLAGANDVTHATPLLRVGLELDAVLAGLTSVVGPRSVVVAGVGRFAGVGAMARPLRDLVDRWADVVRRRQRAVAYQHGVRWVDLSTAASPRYVGRPRAMSADAFHPSGLGYRYWADALLPAVRDAAQPEDRADGTA